MTVAHLLLPTIIDHEVMKMILRFTKNIAINTRAGAAEAVAGFYSKLGLETKELAPKFTTLGPAPYSCYVVSWEPQPDGDSEIALQFETDDIAEVRRRAEENGGTILSFEQDAHNPDMMNLWFRDPGGNLINVTEIGDG
jgi:predicted enzyme related to lactoylglutathione lyase